MPTNGQVSFGSYFTSCPRMLGIVCSFLFAVIFFRILQDLCRQVVGLGWGKSRTVKGRTHSSAKVL
jgi:hypothetical protein